MLLISHLVAADCLACEPIWFIVPNGAQLRSGIPCFSSRPVCMLHYPPHRYLTSGEIVAGLLMNIKKTTPKSAFSLCQSNSEIHARASECMYVLQHGERQTSDIHRRIGLYCARTGAIYIIKLNLHQDSIHSGTALPTYVRNN